MSNDLIVRDDATLTASITGSGVAMKESALQRAALVGKVSNPEEQAIAVAAQIELRRVMKACEESRVLNKAPALEFGKRIDDIAKAFREDLQDEETRIVRLVADFQALEQAKVRAAEAAKRLEEERLERERQAELRRIAEEEQAKQRELDKMAAIIAEAERVNKSKKAKQEQELARLELERQRALAAAESHAQLDAVNERHCEQVAALPTVTAARAEGQVIGWEWDLTVNDAHALYRSHPLCCKLTPMVSEIKALLDAGIVPRGVTAVKKPKSGVRLSPERKAINV